MPDCSAPPTRPPHQKPANSTMPKLEKAAIGVPMALVPKMSGQPPAPIQSPGTLPRHSLDPERTPTKSAHREHHLAGATSNGQHASQNPHHQRTNSYAPFPILSGKHISATKAPANTPRNRVLSDTTRHPFTPLSMNSLQSASERDLVQAGVQCSPNLIPECFHIFSDFSALVKACKESRIQTFGRLIGIYLSAVDRCIRKLESYPEFVKESSTVCSAKGSVEFAIQVMKNFADSIPRDVIEDKKREIAAHMASLAIMLWESVQVLMRVSYQEELYYTVSKELRPSKSTTEYPECYFETESDTQEMMDIRELLKKSLVASSADSIKTVKSSVIEYFHRLSFSRPIRKLRVDPAYQQDVAKAEGTVFTRKAIESFILVENNHPPPIEEPKPFVPCFDITEDIAKRTKGTTLRDSYIFFSAASKLVSAHSEQGFDIDTFKRQWMPSISATEIVTHSKRDSVTGTLKETVSGATFTALVQLLVENVDDSSSTGFIDAFFLFFRFHATPTTFLSTLSSFYKQTNPASPSLQRTSFRSFRKYGKMQALKVLRLWLESHWDEKVDGSARGDIHGFIHHVVQPDRDLPGNIASLLKASMRQSDDNVPVPEVKDNLQLFPHTAFKPRLEHMVSMSRGGHDISLIDIVTFQATGGAEEIARGLTILEADYFHGFAPKDVALLRSGQEPKKFTEWERFTAAVGWWALNSILSHKTLEQRVKAMELFINVAHICMRNLRNFSSAQSIVQALHDNALMRLEGTVTLISSGHKDRLNQMDDFFWGINEYKTALKTRTPAVPIPFLVRDSIMKVSKSCTSHAHRRTKSGERMIDMHYYQGIRRNVRNLEKVHGKLAIPRVEVVLQWIKSVCKPYVGKHNEDVRMQMMAKSYAIEPAQRHPLRRQSSWVTEDDRKRAYLEGYLP